MAQPPSHDDIAKRAQDIAKRRGGARGSEVDDFLQAERELRTERGLPVEKR
jgi:hypothetical protein